MMKNISSFGTFHNLSGQNLVKKIILNIMNIEPKEIGGTGIA
jgi:hypothetical protein